MRRSVDGRRSNAPAHLHSNLFSMWKETAKVKWYWVAQFICRVFTLLFFRYRVYGRQHIPTEGAFIMAGIRSYSGSST